MTDMWLMYTDETYYVLYVKNMSWTGLIYKIYKQLIQDNIKKKKTSNLIKNGQKTWIDIFPKTCRPANRHMKR